MYSKPLLHIRILHHPVRVYFAIMTGLLYVIMLIAWLLGRNINILCQIVDLK